MSAVQRSDRAFLAEYLALIIRSCSSGIAPYADTRPFVEGLALAAAFDVLLSAPPVPAENGEGDPTPNPDVAKLEAVAGGRAPSSDLGSGFWGSGDVKDAGAPTALDCVLSPPATAMVGGAVKNVRPASNTGRIDAAADAAAKFWFGKPLVLLAMDDRSPPTGSSSAAISGSSSSSSSSAAVARCDGLVDWVAGRLRLLSGLLENALSIIEAPFLANGALRVDPTGFHSGLGGMSGRFLRETFAFSKARAHLDRWVATMRGRKPPPGSSVLMGKVVEFFSPSSVSLMMRGVDMRPELDRLVLLWCLRTPEVVAKPEYDLMFYFHSFFRFVGKDGFVPALGISSDRFVVSVLSDNATPEIAGFVEKACSDMADSGDLAKRVGRTAAAIFCREYFVGLADICDRRARTTMHPAVLDARVHLDDMKQRVQRALLGAMVDEVRATGFTNATDEEWGRASEDGRRNGAILKTLNEGGDEVGRMPDSVRTGSRLATTMYWNSLSSVIATLQPRLQTLTESVERLAFQLGVFKCISCLLPTDQTAGLLPSFLRGSNEVTDGISRLVALCVKERPGSTSEWVVQNPVESAMKIVIDMEREGFFANLDDCVGNHASKLRTDLERDVAEYSRETLRLYMARFSAAHYAQASRGIAMQEHEIEKDLVAGAAASDVQRLEAMAQSQERRGIQAYLETWESRVGFCSRVVGSLETRLSAFATCCLRRGGLYRQLSGCVLEMEDVFVKPSPVVLNRLLELSGELQSRLDGQSVDEGSGIIQMMADRRSPFDSRRPALVVRVLIRAVATLVARQTLVCK